MDMIERVEGCILSAISVRRLGISLVFRLVEDYFKDFTISLL